jgi:hypothetical protein
MLRAACCVVVGTQTMNARRAATLRGPLIEPFQGAIVEALWLVACACCQPLSTSVGSKINLFKISPVAVAS